MGKGLVVKIVDAEIFREGKKLPCWREPGRFAESGDGEVEKQDGQVSRQDTEGASQIEAADRRPAAPHVRTKKLRADEVSAQHKEKIDAHPAIACWPGPNAGTQRKTHMPQHDPENGNGPHQVKTRLADGRCIEELQTRLL
jgi:hypothetical protein